jgi:hypothetical protein
LSNSKMFLWSIYHMVSSLYRVFGNYHDLSTDLQLSFWQKIRKEPCVVISLNFLSSVFYKNMLNIWLSCVHYKYCYHYKVRKFSPRY